MHKCCHSVTLISFLVYVCFDSYSLTYLPHLPVKQNQPVNHQIKSLSFCVCPSLSPHTRTKILSPHTFQFTTEPNSIFLLLLFAKSLTIRPSLSSFLSPPPLKKTKTKSFELKILEGQKDKVLSYTATPIFISHVSFFFS